MNLLPAGAAERRRLVWLVAVMLALAALLFWNQRPPAVPGTTASNAQAQGQASDAGTMVRPEAVNLAVLDDVPESPEPGRNPFAFGVRPPPPAPPAPPPAPMVEIPTAPPVPQGPPAIALRLVGAMKMPDGRTMVTLKDPATNGLFQAFENDVVDGRYRVTKITMQSALLSYVDGSGARTVRLGG
jgi:hypothetical protein